MTWIGYRLILLISILIPSMSMAGGNINNDSFSKSKKILLEKVYFDHRETFYCGCIFNKDKSIIPSDKYTSKRSNKRAQRIEWEHVVPAEAFGRSFPQWRDGHESCVDRKGRAFKGRNCARKVSNEFRLMEADLYNLVPALGEINGDRSNYSYAEIPGEPREYGACDFEVQDRKVEPAPEIRGDIARTYFYMDQAYPGHGIISKKNQRLFEVWSAQDPVDAWECERAQRIKAIQGNINPFVIRECKE
ncbi:MAG: endonuclease [Bacteroidetes bacterium]|nr:endonuclease [Bacteroidota bacterium]